MIEIWLLGTLVTTLGSTVALALVVLALTAAAYLAVTLTPALRGPTSGRGARPLAFATGVVTLTLALAGLRVGSPGSLGELLPTLALALATAAAAGSTMGLVWTGVARGLRAAGDARVAQARRLESARAEDVKRLDTGRQAYLDGEDLRAEVEEADAAVRRLRTSLDRLGRSRAALTIQLAAMNDAASGTDLGRDLAGAHDDLTTKLHLGGKILTAAATAAFRLACTAPVKRLLRRRPHDATKDLGEEPARIEVAAEEIRSFLADAESARATLAALEPRRDPDDPADPWGGAVRDLDAVTGAYSAVLERLLVVRVRLTAREEMDAVASAAGEVSDRARASGLDAADLSALVGEVSRAELAISLATPGDLDSHALTDALARSTLALDRGDDASIDDLLRAMRELA